MRSRASSSITARENAIYAEDHPDHIVEIHRDFLA